jgi:hypothetical protein
MLPVVVLQHVSKSVVDVREPEVKNSEKAQDETFEGNEESGMLFERTMQRFVEV